MNRRALLELGSFAALSLAWPPMLARAFESGARHGDYDADLLRTALASARLVGKPVLVLVVPENSAERQLRGSLWGVLVECASDEMLAVLALVEPVCVRSRALHPLGARLDDEPHAFLVEQETGTSLTAIRAPVAEFPTSGNARLLTARDFTSWAEPLGLAVFRAIAGDVARVFELELRARTALGRDTLAEVERDLRELTVPPRGRVERAAAVYYAAALRGRAVTNGWLDSLLVNAAVARWRTRAPDGAQWSSPPGLACVAGPCGTAYTPGPSRRFLSFLTGSN